MLKRLFSLLCLIVPSPAVAAAPVEPVDWRDIRHGRVIPDEGYCDQPYVVITTDGNWLCTLTTGKGIEGQGGQHVVATISKDQGLTWSPLIDIEPADGPEASWAMPLLTPSGRVYVFYDYNGDRIDHIGKRRIFRADMLGWYVYKYSDDNGRTWSPQRYRLPVRMTDMDYGNDYNGDVQMLWGIGKPIIAGHSVLFGFSKIGRYLIDVSEGWFFRSDNLLNETDPRRIRWEMLPEGNTGLCSPNGPISEEQNLVVLNDGTLYTMYRTTEGHPCHAYSVDGGRSWTGPEYATYTPGGRRIMHPRACPRLWKTKDGRYLFWFHNHGMKSYEGRNPAWLLGGIERQGRIHWSQPEIVLYDDDPDVRTSYPDLIEQGGRVFITETQKEIARVHEIDPMLLEGMWNQGRDRTVSRHKLVFTWGGGILPASQSRNAENQAGKTPAPQGSSVKLPPIPNLQPTAGITLDLWLQAPDYRPGQVLLDTRDDAGKGLTVMTAEPGTLRIEMSDGRSGAYWDCDPVLVPGKQHHVVIVIDGGPRIISTIVDGQFCDGAGRRPYGWGRFSLSIKDINGDGVMRIAPSFRGRIDSLRYYARPLRTSEAVGHFHAGPPK